jgi:hypothetical protein
VYPRKFSLCPTIKIIRHKKIALTISKLKALLNKTQAKRFGIPDRDGMSVRVSNTDHSLFNIAIITKLHGLL